MALDFADAAVIADDMITATQCKMARIGLGWSQEKLAEAISVSAGTIKNFEAGRTVMPIVSTAIERTLTEAGAVFVPEDDQFIPGVRLRKGRE
jgi:DNA-binding XRE family transcriptional regulator